MSTKTPPDSTKAPEREHDCVVTSCTVRAKRSELVKFPGNPDTCEEWAKSLGLQFFKKTSYVCPAHFIEDDFYVFQNGEKRIKKGRVPKVNQSVRPSISLLSFSKFLAFQKS